MEHKKNLVNLFLEKGILISPDYIDHAEQFKPDTPKGDFLVLYKDTGDFFGKDIDWKKFDMLRVMSEKGNQEDYAEFIKSLRNKGIEKNIPPEKKENNGIKVIFSYKSESKKRNIQDFVALFNARYKSMERLLRERRELQNLMSINRIRNKKDRESVSLIGMVKKKQTTKNKNLILEVEDPTGCIKILINKNKPAVYKRATEIVPDEILGIVGSKGNNILFANAVIWPDIPDNTELKKADEETYAIVISDLHIGSKNFLPDELSQFIEWINGKIGNEEQKQIAGRIKYCFVVGDLIDGVGIYPGQDDELEIKDIYKQYEICAQWLKKIPQNIQLIICPGNHDAMRLAEPQPELYRDFAGKIWDLPNVTMVSNPAVVNIHASKSFSGFNCLLYHGYSFDYYVANVDSIRNQGGYDRADLIMQFLLQRRHLAPTHASTLYIPETDYDPLFIKNIPDFFITGHIHKASASNYRGITMICGSCWQSKTSFQEKVGHNPEPARVPIINLKTREIKMLKFGQ